MSARSAAVTIVSLLAVVLDLGGGTRAATAPADDGPRTLHVRVDGGTAAQCSGLVDAPWTGRTRRCALASPLVALPPAGRPLLRGGDTLLIHRGSYRMGHGGPGSAGCDTAWTYDCHLAPVPSGTAARPTRVLGEGWHSGCRRAPELWGTERASHVLDLTGSSHVVVACLEITDHDACVEAHSAPAMTCRRDAYPHGDWASVGIAASDSADVVLRDLDVHGLANTGVRAGRLRDWRVQRVRVALNGWAGWDGDLGEETRGWSTPPRSRSTRACAPGAPPSTRPARAAPRAVTSSAGDAWDAPTSGPWSCAADEIR